jgi:YesN/AraC family two-component response regulator
MRGMTGVKLAKELKRVNPKMNIIFVTGFSDYATDAMSLHASGYIMKPVNQEKVERELSRVQSEIDAKQAVFNALKNDVTQYEINVEINKKQIKGPLGYLFSGIEYVVVKLFIWN